MRDVFVNKTIFYREVDDLLTEALSYMNWAKRWTKDIRKSRWADAAVRKNADSIDFDCDHAIDALVKCCSILTERRKVRASSKINHELDCLEMLTVIRGGRYEANAVVTYAGISDEFKEFFAEDEHRS